MVFTVFLTVIIFVILLGFWEILRELGELAEYEIRG